MWLLLNALESKEGGGGLCFDGYCVERSEYQGIGSMVCYWSILVAMIGLCCHWPKSVVEFLTPWEVIHFWVELGVLTCPLPVPRPRVDKEIK